MIEEQQGGTTPPADADAEAPAPEQTDAATAVADDPAETMAVAPNLDESDPPAPAERSEERRVGKECRL